MTAKTAPRPGLSRLPMALMAAMPLLAACDTVSTITPEGLRVYDTIPHTNTLASTRVKCRSLDEHVAGCDADLRVRDGGKRPTLIIGLVDDCRLDAASIQTADGSYALDVRLNYEDPALLVLHKDDVLALSQGGFVTLILEDCHGPGETTETRLAAIELPAAQMGAVAARIEAENFDT